MTNEEYGRYVDALAPRSKTGKNLLNAFWVGGLICAIGQALLNGYQALGLDETTAGAGREHLTCAALGHPDGLCGL